MSHTSTAPAWTAVLTRVIALWLPIAVATTGLAGIIYGATQQELRLTADDPQMALLLRTAARLDDGLPPAAAIPADHIDLADSLDPFVLVFDASGQVLASSATLHGRMPEYPTGVFETVRARGEDRVTWQPENGIRDGTIAVAWRGGYVVAGRSLRLTEQHVDQIGVVVGVGWLATLALVAVAAGLATLLNPPADWPTLSLGSWRIVRSASSSA